MVGGMWEESSHDYVIQEGVRDRGWAKITDDFGTERGQKCQKKIIT
jgi:hypothetical protein